MLCEARLVLIPFGVRGDDDDGGCTIYEVFVNYWLVSKRINGYDIRVD